MSTTAGVITAAPCTCSIPGPPCLGYAPGRSAVIRATSHEGQEERVDHRRGHHSGDVVPGLIQKAGQHLQVRGGGGISMPDLDQTQLPRHLTEANSGLVQQARQHLRRRNLWGIYI